ncbi:ribosomal protein S18 acetylase RimI-like enzyme [Solibacillus kalamii]|uniref:GNAT family N-acetyltransferase n=1 Tax=Solibacillus kalamii TaxID=1748298 RepID=A0ABX3ZBQ2_9BACL|nr:GNAT family N-acetyltransferase [Solibacillus kalamii]MBM7667298.1 ribosomal protein S18 acetylase RimI-like enzyme [Solibacillus kalamii]OUZ37267.1 GNAT family N-acetyltransferase [Solibacillus kalamii]
MNIRKANRGDAPGIAKVHVDSWRTTYKGIIPQNFLDGLSYEQRTKLWENNISDQTNTIFVAENENIIIGFVTGSTRSTNKEVGASDLTSIYLLEEWQGQSVGKKLLNQIMTSLLEQGYQKVYVDVLADNKTKQFYQYYGAEYVKTVQLSIAGKTLEEEIYVWNSVEKVIQQSK